MDDLRALGDGYLKDNPEGVKERARTVKADSLATLIYTSGTTGKPKGVELTHSNWTYEGAFVESVNILTINDVQFLWLPLAHSFGKVLLSLQLQVGLRHRRRRPGSEDRGQPAHRCSPRSWPLFRASSRRSTRRSRRPHCPRAARRPRSSRGRSRSATRPPRRNWPVRRSAAGLAIKRSIADKLVFSKIRERLGGHMRYMISGSAALSQGHRAVVLHRRACPSSRATA